MSDEKKTEKPAEAKTQPKLSRGPRWTHMELAELGVETLYGKRVEAKR